MKTHESWNSHTIQVLGTCVWIVAPDRECTAVRDSSALRPSSAAATGACVRLARSCLYLKARWSAVAFACLEFHCILSLFCAALFFPSVNDNFCVRPRNDGSRKELARHCLMDLWEEQPASPGGVAAASGYPTVACSEKFTKTQAGLLGSRPLQLPARHPRRSRDSE